MATKPQRMMRIRWVCIRGFAPDGLVAFRENRFGVGATCRSPAWISVRVHTGDRQVAPTILSAARTFAYMGERFS